MMTRTSCARKVDCSFVILAFCRKSWKGLVDRRRSFQFTQFHRVDVIEFALSSCLAHGPFHCVEARLRQRVFAFYRLRSALGFG